MKIRDRIRIANKIINAMEKNNQFIETVENMVKSDSWIVLTTHRRKRDVFYSIRNINIVVGEQVRLIEVLEEAFESEKEQLSTLIGFKEMLDTPDDGKDD